MSKKPLSYTQAINEIENLIQRIETQDLSVDELSDKIKRISFLLKFCKDKLHQTENEIDAIINDIN